VLESTVETAFKLRVTRENWLHDWRQANVRFECGFLR
jgi:hypothetical protein